MTALKVVTVRLPEELHREIKVRLAERGDSFEGVARAAFVAYLGRDPSVRGSLLERAGVRPVVDDFVEPANEPFEDAGRRPFTPDPKGKK